MNAYYLYFFEVIDFGESTMIEFGKSTKTEEKSSSSGSLGCCLGPMVGIASIVATLSLGPIDFGRSVYNQLVGDTPVLKAQLLEYVRKGVKAERSNYSPAQLEGTLARELSHDLKGAERIDPTTVSIEELWDASERFAPNVYQQFIWPELGK